MRKGFLLSLAISVLLGGAYAGTTTAAKEQSSPPPGAKVVERPELKPGSWWLFRTKTDYEFKSILKEVKSDGTLIVEEWELPQPNIYTAEWNIIRGIGVRRREPNDFSPHNYLFSFPLWEGKRWTFDFDYKGPWHGSIRGSAQVASWEKITVPAGTFLVLKTVRTGKWFSGTTTGPVSTAAWYSPEVKRVVKFEVENYADVSYELVAYELK